jgi:hypothetical protein
LNHEKRAHPSEARLHGTNRRTQIRPADLILLDKLVPAERMISVCRHHFLEELI